MQKLKTVIIDDEPKARETIFEMLKLYCPDIEVIGEAENVKSGLEIIKNKNPNLVFLDIQMPDGTGFDLLKRIQSIDFKFIIITAYKEHAIKAFKFSAIDYILKPIDPDELIEAVKKVNQTLQVDNPGIQLQSYLNNLLSPDKKIVLRTAESIHLVRVSKIIHCESSSNYTWFYLVDGKKLLVSKTLKEYDEILSSSGFFRSHQSHLININFIDRFEKSDGGYLILKDGSQIPVSFRKKEHLLKLFDQF